MNGTNQRAPERLATSIDPKHRYAPNEKEAMIYYCLEKRKHVFVWQIHKYHNEDVSNQRF